MKMLLLLLALTTTSFSAPLSDVDKASITPKNELSNPGAESLTAGWSVSGGTFTTTGTAANVGSGKRAFSWDSSAAAQTLSSPVVQVNGKAGSNGAVAVRVKAASGAPTHKLQAYDGSVVLAEVSIAASTSAFQRNVINFIFPSSGTVRVRLVSVAANEPLIYVDDGYLGLADGFNLGVLSQAYHYGSMSVTNCTGVTQWTTGGYNDQSAGGTACTYTATGKLSAPSGAYMGFSTAFEPGEYLITIGHAGSLTAGGTALGTRISNGTVHSKSPTKQVIGSTGNSSVPTDTYSLTVSTPLSVSDFRFQVNMSAGTYSSDTSGANEFTFDVYKFPTLNQQAQTFDTVANSWSGNHGSDCSWTTTSTSLVLPAMDASCTFTEVANVNFGTVTSYNDGTPGNNYPGIVFTPSRAGTYFICGNPQLAHNTQNEQAEIQLEDISSTKIASAWIRMATGAGSDSASATVAACGLYKATGVASKTIRMRLRSSTGAGTAGISASGQSDAISWSIVQIDQQLPAPLIVGGVVTPSAGVVSLCGATVSAGGSPVVSTGDCVSFTALAGTGNYTMAFPAGQWSATPFCTCTPSDTVFTAGCAVYSTTSTGASIFTNSSHVASSSVPFNLTCIGQK